MMDADFTVFRASVAESLIRQGWNACDGTAIVSRDYETAVGTKRAFVYLAEWRGQANCTLQGDYRSEGRNILECAPVLIPKDASAEQIDSLVRKFHDYADKLIEQSYARNLYNRGHRPQPATATDASA